MNLTMEERDALQYESKAWFTPKLSSIICIMTYVYIIIYVCVFSSRRQNELFASGTKIQVIRFGGGPCRFTVFCSDQH